MPFEITVDRARRRAIGVRSGHGDMSEVMACIEGVLGHSDYEVGFDIVFDLRQATFIPQGLAAHTVARFLGERRERIGGRVALVTTANTTEAVSARFLALLEAFEGVDARAFNSLEGAERWLAEPLPYQPPR